MSELLLNRTDIKAIHLRRAALGLEQSVEHAKRGAFASTVRSQQTSDLAVGREKRYVLNGFYLAK